METEFEVKFSPIKLDQFRKKLKLLGAKLVVPMRKMRRAIFDGKLHPQFKCDYIRVRDEGGKTRLSSKIHAKEDGQISDQKETEEIVENFERTIELFKAMGLEMDRYQETEREEWRYKSTSVVIDLWPWLEPAIEIEGESEEKVKQVVMNLGLDWNSRIITSRVELYMKAYGLNEEETLLRMSSLTFEGENPFVKNG